MIRLIATLAGLMLGTKNNKPTTRRPAPARLTLETCEAREVPAALVTFPVAGGPVSAGQWVTLSDQILVSNPGSTINGVVYTTSTHSGDLSADLTNSFLFVDFYGINGKGGPDGNYDAAIPAIKIYDQLVVLGNLPVASGFARMTLVGQIANGADGNIGVDPKTFVVGQNVNPFCTQNYGFDNPMFHVPTQVNATPTIPHMPTVPPTTTLPPVVVPPTVPPTVPPVVPPVVPPTVPPPAVYAPLLDVSVKSMGTRDVVVRNQNNVNLFRAEVYAGASQGAPRDILTTSLSFRAEEGWLGDMRRYQLWADTDGNGQTDTVIQDDVTAQNDRLTFDNIVGGGYVTPAGETTLFEVHGYVASSTRNTSFRLGLDTASPGYWQAEQVNSGESLQGIVTDGVGQGQIRVVTTPAITLEIANQGNLFVTQSVTPIQSKLILGGSSAEVLRLTLRAEGEAIDVTKLAFEIQGRARSIDRLDLYKAGDTTPFASATVGATGSDVVGSYPVFTARMQSRQLVVAAGTNQDIRVVARIKTDVDGGVSGDSFQVSINPGNAIDTASGLGAVHARGDASFNNLLGNDRDARPEGEVFIGTWSAGDNRAIVSPAHTITMSMVTSVVDANPDPANSNIPTGPSNVWQGKFTAASHWNSLNGLNKWVGHAFIFHGNADNVLLANEFWLYNKAYGFNPIHILGHAYDAQGMLITTATVTGEFSLIFDVQEGSLDITTISAGNTATFVVQENILNSQISSSRPARLSTTLQSNELGWYDADTNAVSFTGLHLNDADITNVYVN